MGNESLDQLQAMFIMTIAIASRQAAMPITPRTISPPPVFFTAFFLPKTGMDDWMESLTGLIKAFTCPAGKAEITSVQSSCLVPANRLRQTTGRTGRPQAAKYDFASAIVC